MRVMVGRSNTAGPLLMQTGCHIQQIKQAEHLSTSPLWLVPGLLHDNRMRILTKPVVTHCISPHSGCKEPEGATVVRQPVVSPNNH